MITIKATASTAMTMWMGRMARQATLMPREVAVTLP